MKITLRNRRHDRQRNTRVNDEAHSSLGRVERARKVTKVIMKFSLAIYADVHLCVDAFEESSVSRFEQSTVGANCDLKPADSSCCFQHLIKVAIHKRLTAGEIESPNAELPAIPNCVEHRLQRQLLTT